MVIQLIVHVPRVVSHDTIVVGSEPIISLAILNRGRNLLRLVLLLHHATLSSLLRFNFLNCKVFVQEFSEHFLRELAPELRKKVASRQQLRSLMLRVDTRKGNHCEHVVVDYTQLRKRRYIIKRCQI